MKIVIFLVPNLTYYIHHLILRNFFFILLYKKSRIHNKFVYCNLYIYGVEHMQSKKDKEEADATERTKEAADAVKDGAKEVRKTCEFMRDTVETSSQKASTCMSNSY